jgi:hypothetical protein
MPRRFAALTLCLVVPATTLGADRIVTLEDDVLPVLTRTGCNAGACHGKARGQNGFQLSLLAFDPDFDYQAMVTEGRGRRVLPAAPDSSLLLLKGSARVPHGGGKRISPGDGFYETLRAWIVAGAPRKAAGTATLARVTVEPAEKLLAYHQEQPLKVIAHFSDGTSKDVTRLASFQSSESVIATVTAGGLVKAGPLPGEAAVMARYLDAFAVCNVLIPLPGNVDPRTYTAFPADHVIDRLAVAKWKQLGVTPSADCGDAAFLRRAHLDVIGRLPTAAEAKAFLADAEPTKREKLVDRLLERPEYADFWANKWADLLRPNPYRVGMKATYLLDGWLRQAFRENRPYDQFARDVITAQGSTFRNGAAVVFRDRRDPPEITTMISQLFLGIRLDCARCHHHPFEVYGQDEFFSFAAYFARIGRKGTGLSPPISGSEEVVFTAKKGTVNHPITGKEMSPKPLYGTAPPVAEGDDPREALATWVTSPENVFFRRVIVNRVWADLMGRGFVEPVDDLRATNPPSNPQLLDALADDFKAKGYDLKKLLRTILTSRVYALASAPTDRNAADNRTYARHYRQRLRAEVLLDAVCDVTGEPESFAATPPGTRAAAVWTNRSDSVFLDSFGRPDPNQDPPCERTTETTVVQALHLMNAGRLHAKLTADGGRVAKLAASAASPAEIVDELYLSAYSRTPTGDEKAAALRHLGKPGLPRRQAVEDLLWALLNTPEFTFKD